jgi:transposase
MHFRFLIIFFPLLAHSMELSTVSSAVSTVPIPISNDHFTSVIDRGQSILGYTYFDSCALISQALVEKITAAPDAAKRFGLELGLAKLYLKRHYFCATKTEAQTQKHIFSSLNNIIENDQNKSQKSHAYTWLGILHYQKNYQPENTNAQPLDLAWECFKNAFNLIEKPYIKLYQADMILNYSYMAGQATTENAIKLAGMLLDESLFTSSESGKVSYLRTKLSIQSQASKTPKPNLGHTDYSGEMKNFRHELIEKLSQVQHSVTSTTTPGSASALPSQAPTATVAMDEDGDNDAVNLSGFKRKKRALLLEDEDHEEVNKAPLAVDPTAADLGTAILPDKDKGTQKDTPSSEEEDTSSEEEGSADSSEAASQKKRKKSDLSQAEIEEIVNLARDGTPNKALEIKYNTSSQVVSAILLEHGVRRYEKRKFLNIEEKEKITQLHNRGMSPPEIAKQLGVTISCVYSHLRHQKPSLTPSEIKEKKLSKTTELPAVTSLSQEVIEKVVELLKANTPHKEISTKCGATRRQITKISQESGLRNRTLSKPLSADQQKRALELLADPKNTQRAVAESIGATEFQINTLAKKNGLGRRPRKES